ncbi:MAG: DUF192 domain-containing protein [Paracoccus sp. (in: a-proteobacteria)]
MKLRCQLGWAAAVPLTLAGTAVYPASSCLDEFSLFHEAEAAFHVEIADDPDERAQGLMYRGSLAPDSGMLFIYEMPQEVSFWMKNTLIPLDMIFMDASGTIRYIYPSARPYDLTAIPGARAGDPAPERLMVLEIAGGESARLGLTEGMAMSHPRLNQTQAAIPCQ